MEEWSGAEQSRAVQNRTEVKRKEGGRERRGGHKEETRGVNNEEVRDRDL